jgi:hypothetical protein
MKFHQLTTPSTKVSWYKSQSRAASQVTWSWLLRNDRVRVVGQIRLPPVTWHDFHQSRSENPSHVTRATNESNRSEWQKREFNGNFRLFSEDNRWNKWQVQGEMLTTDVSRRRRFNRNWWLVTYGLRYCLVQQVVCTCRSVILRVRPDKIESRSVWANCPKIISSPDYCRNFVQKQTQRSQIVIKTFDHFA